jgi:hypothetical protein
MFMMFVARAEFIKLKRNNSSTSWHFIAIHKRECQESRDSFDSTRDTLINSINAL